MRKPSQRVTERQASSSSVAPLARVAEAPEDDDGLGAVVGVMCGSACWMGLQNGARSGWLRPRRRDDQWRSTSHGTIGATAGPVGRGSGCFRGKPLADSLDANEILSVGWRRPLSLDACLNAGYRTLRLALSRPGSADDGSPLGSLRCCSPLQVRSPRSWVGNASAAGGTRLSGSCLPYTGPRCSGCGTHSRVNSLHESV
jgi:hypothetical protein